MSVEKLDILSTDLNAKGEIRCKLGNSATDEGMRESAICWGTAGFYARPKAAAKEGSNEGACVALYTRSGHSRNVVATKDNRLIPKYGDIAEGDRAIVGYGDARFIMKDASDSVSLMTKNHADNDQLMLLQLNGQKGELTIMIGGQQGTSLFKMKSGVIHMSVDGGGSLTIDKNGISVTGNSCSLATACGHLGVLGAVAPPPGAQSICTGTIGQTAVGSLNWTCAP